jgi:hypothetical protein
MNRHLVRLLLTLYPRPWRDRYGTEVVRLTQELIATGETTPTRGALNMAAAALAERFRVLAESSRTAVAMAVVALLAVAASFYAGVHARPQKPPSAAGTQPVAAKVTGDRCDFELGSARGVVVPAGDAETAAIAVGTETGNVTPVVIPVDATGPDGLRPVTFPANMKQGQFVCVVAVPNSAEPASQSAVPVPPPPPSGS